MHMGQRRRLWNCIAREGGIANVVKVGWKGAGEGARAETPFILTPILQQALTLAGSLYHPRGSHVSVALPHGVLCRKL
jgi:hypothetical protein